MTTRQECLRNELLNVLRRYGITHCAIAMHDNATSETMHVWTMSGGAWFDKDATIEMLKQAIEEPSRETVGFGDSYSVIKHPA